MSTSPASRPFRVAIVGAGPAGFYAADRLLRAEKDLDVEVELYDRLPTPWGLVRAGVAPDHPKIKSVTRMYEKTARAEGFRFHGNVEVGSDVTHAELLAHHHAVIYTYGAAVDRRLGIPGEELPGSVPATEFVAWYNGHPDACHHAFRLDGTRAVVIGNGNVAVDVARMLVLARDELASTDIADEALEALAASTIEEVVILGRRGPAQAAYTTPELRELGELEQADVIVDPTEVELDEVSRAWLESDEADRTARDNVEIVHEYAARPPGGKPRRVVLRYLRSPVEIVGTDRVEGVRVVRNELLADEDGNLRAHHTGDEELIPCELVLRSVGYRGVGIEGLPFDERAGTILNAGGRVLSAPGGPPLPGVYTAGWIKRGPSGVIGTNKKCANETVDLLLEDLAAGRLPEPPHHADELAAMLAGRGASEVDYAGWERIDEHERATGEAQGRPRVKVTRREELLAKSRGEG
jgi:ferredoxin--NADP+ reductase